jgi:hypothetical protein
MDVEYPNFFFAEGFLSCLLLVNFKKGRGEDMIGGMEG